MLTKSVNGDVTGYNYNNANQLIEEIQDNQTVSYIYNANGDLTAKSTGEQYSYDIQGNLTEISGNGIDKEYTYNGNGNRLSESTDGETIYYVNDINRAYEQVLQTYNDDDVINTYTYGLQRIDSKGQTNATYLYDGRGSVVGSVNENNQFVSYSYTAYGELMQSSPEPNTFGYNAEATDYDTGVQYLRARYYDTSVQRFVQEDDYRGSVQNPITLNRYAYTGNNPVSYNDPSGHVQEWSAGGGGGTNYGTVPKAPDLYDTAYYAADTHLTADDINSILGNNNTSYTITYPWETPTNSPISPGDEDDDFICDVNPEDFGLMVDEDGNIIRQPWLHVDDPAVQAALEDYLEESNAALNAYTEKYENLDCDYFITNPYNLDADKTKEELLNAMLEQTTDPALKHLVEMIIEEGNENGYDFLNINSLEVNDIAEGLDPNSEEARSIAEAESAGIEAELMERDGVYNTISSTLVGTAFGGPIGTAAGFFAGIATVIISGSDHANSTGYSMTSLHYEYEIQIDFTSDSMTFDENGDIYMPNTFYTGEISGQVGPGNQTDNKNNFIYADVTTNTPVEYGGVSSMYDTITP